ncbi:phage major capsid protein [Pseudarthrobacter polychromogenes]|uniref:Bacteriophage Mu GpT domain-containing protein n=1 Tax=Pseudarthrobacter polychromogenes TaxID=1676 RepID=A0ABQ1X962_9MICC|nr:hypothetical protein [Pseudarthrobacter polychromogenes]GGG83647.1 hypothetical protein GCM10011577_01370 [Pseudarthrobacter polychromogenes]
MDLFDNKGWRKAPTREERVFEAAKFFGQGRSGGAIAQAEVAEAFSTSDFPVLLGAAFTKKAVAAQKAAVDEFEPVLTHTTAPDFERHKLIDLWSGDEFERVREGEEYKGGTLNETDLTHGTAKYGKSYGLTFELRLRRLFTDLANFPTLLGSGAVKAKNSAVAELLVEAGAWDPAFFDTVANVALTPESLDAALKELALREDHRADLVDTTNLVLMVGPALQSEANRILNAEKLSMEVTVGSKVTKTEIANPFRGVVTLLVSRRLGKSLGANQGKAWALVQGKGSTLPSIIDTGLEGHDGNVDIRVKRDQGEAVGGGQISIEEGSFNDDTIWYRGRTFFGIDKGFTTGVYASNGGA